MKNKVIRFPISYRQRERNEMEKGHVPCEISGRWLQFNTSSTLCGIGELIELSFLTKSKKRGKHRICNLVVTKDYLIRALNSIEPFNK